MSIPPPQMSVSRLLLPAKLMQLMDALAKQAAEMRPEGRQKGPRRSRKSGVRGRARQVPPEFSGSCRLQIGCFSNGPMRCGLKNSKMEC